MGESRVFLDPKNQEKINFLSNLPGFIHRELPLPFFYILPPEFSEQERDKLDL